MSVILGVDIGGTFTDAVTMDVDSGKFVSTKVPSTPEDFSRGFFNALDKILEKAGASPKDVIRLIHGTTVATNSIVQWKGAKIGIITTKGFRDIIIIGRSTRAEMYDFQYGPQTPTFICDRERIMEVTERTDVQGNVVTPLEEDDVVKAADYFVQEHGVEAIAVCFLFSFLNPEHEERTRRIINERYPDIRVSLSSRVNPRFREYERLVITAFDAYVGPETERYIRKLEEQMRNRHIDIALQVMQSRGGITSGGMCMEKPVVTLLSGPAGGVVGGNFIGGLCGRKNLITLDMGGTSCDVALIRDRKPYVYTEGKIGTYPLRQAMLDISTIGAGGGSLARVDSAGGLHVGPDSAGADPGPACYGRGGEEPTVTDASVVLGYLNPKYFAAGEIALNSELAGEAVQKHIAAPLNMGAPRAAAGIHRIVNNNMADQLRLVSVYKGYHPRDFSLVAFGGAGPVVAGRLMQLLRLKEVIIPTNPGVLSAFGLLAAEISHEEVATLPLKADEADPGDIEKVFGHLEQVCEQNRRGVGITQTRLRIHRSTEMRYVGQAFELEVPFPEGKGRITKDIIRNVIERFHNVHQSIYQHSHPGDPVEFIAYRVVFSQEPEPMPTFSELTPGAEATPKGTRLAYFDEYNDYVDIPLYERAALVAGQKIKGPAIVEQEDTTTVIYPVQQADVDDWGNLILAVIQ